MSSSTSTPKPSREAIRAACAALTSLLTDKAKYAVLGGAACQLLGSKRITEDVDFVVPKGEIKNARTLITADKDHFTVDKRTLHTYFISESSPPVEIEIISPPGTFMEPFEQSTATHSIELDGVSIEVLHPLLIFNAKCRSILGRSNDEKKRSDGADIIFLLGWLAQHEMFPEAKSVPNVDKEFVEWFIGVFGWASLWTSLKYDLERGSF